MVDPRLYDEDAFVVLETDQEEQILSPDELRDRLKHVLATHPDSLPADVAARSPLDAQVEYLVTNYCELTPNPDQFIQWYAVRLEK